MLYDAIVLGRTAAAIEAVREAVRLDLRVLVVPDAGTGPCNGPAHTPSLDTSANGREIWRGGPPTPEAPVAECEIERLGALGVDVEALHGLRFDEAGMLRTESGECLEAPVVVIATGDRPRRPARFPFDDRIVCDSESVFRSRNAPRNVLVIGAERDGCAVACVLAAMGSSVTVIDRRRRCLRYVDREILELLHASMQGRGIELILDEWLTGIEIFRAGSEPYAVVSLSSGRREVCENVVVAAGRVASCEGLNLAAAGIEMDELGFVRVDERGRTSREGVYAAGTVAGGLGESGEGFQGRMAIRDALGTGERVEQPLPILIGTIPEVGLVGLTVEACERLGLPWVAGLAHRASLDPIVRDNPGLLKLVANADSGELLGVHCIGSGAKELIQLGAWMMRKASTIGEIASTIAVTPSLAEAFTAAALDCEDAFERATEGEPPLDETGRW